MLKPTLAGRRSIFALLAPLFVAVAVAGCGGAEEGGADGSAPQESAAELEARARGIHERVITIDTHDDIPFNFATPGEMDPGERGNRQVDLPKMREGGLDVAFFVVYVGQPRGEGGGLDDAGYARALEQAMQKFEGIHRLAEEMHPDEIGFAAGPDDVERLHAEGKLAAAIGIENGYPMGEDLSLIAKFKELGAGYMSITHNGHNQLGDSQTPGWYATEEEPDRALHGGLSELGRQAVAEMNRQGIMVDISHAGRQTDARRVAGLRGASHGLPLERLGAARPRSQSRRPAAQGAEGQRWGHPDRRLRLLREGPRRAQRRHPGGARGARGCLPSVAGGVAAADAARRRSYPRRSGRHAPRRRPSWSGAWSTSTPGTR